MALLAPADLADFVTGLTDAQIAVMIADVEALAVQAAPCLAGELPDQARAAVLAVLRSAVMRWADQASAGDRQLTAGPFTIGAMAGAGEQQRGPLLRAHEVTQLQAVCAQLVGRTPGKVGQFRLGTPDWWHR